MIRDYIRMLAVLTVLTGLAVGAFYTLLPTPTLAGECASGPCCMSITINPDGTYTQMVYDCVTKQVVRVQVGKLRPKW